MHFTGGALRQPRACPPEAASTAREHCIRFIGRSASQHASVDWIYCLISSQESGRSNVFDSLSPRDKALAPNKHSRMQTGQVVKRISFAEGGFQVAFLEPGPRLLRTTA